MIETYPAFGLKETTKQPTACCSECALEPRQTNAVHTKVRYVPGLSLSSIDGACRTETLCSAEGLQLVGAM